MKKLIFAALLISIWACNSERKQNDVQNEMPDHQSEMTDMDSQEGYMHVQDTMAGDHHMTGENHAEQMVAMLNVDKKFLEQLDGVFKATIPLKDAFVESDPEKVKVEADKVIKQLGNVDSKLLGTQTHEIWMENLMDIAHLVSKIKNGTSIEEQRENFALYNKALYRSFKFLGHEGDPIYYQYCPMAFNNKGAYWLSNTEEIRNPYFGDKMLTCGSTKEVIN